MKYILTCYIPLCTSKYGRCASEKFKISPYVDASCCREPDFELDNPSITSLCHGDLVNRLEKCYTNEGGVIITYLTKKGTYEKGERHYRLAASLELIKICKDHDEAADWYKSKKSRLPYNCMITGNDFLPEEKTAKIYRKKAWPFAENYKEAIKRYKDKAKKKPLFVITKKIFCNLQNPPIITDKQILKIFNRNIGLQGSPYIEEAEYKKLKAIIDAK